jgi:hypothetical protein
LIKYKKRIKQVLNFKGVGNSKIHPTDIDAVLEFDNKYLIMFEVKYKGVKVPTGQELVLKRIADAWQINCGDAFVVYCSHETKVDEVVDMANTKVYEVYHDKKKYKRDQNIRQFLQTLAKHYKITKLEKAL